MPFSTSSRIKVAMIWFYHRKLCLCICMCMCMYMYIYRTCSCTVSYCSKIIIPYNAHEPFPLFFFFFRAPNANAPDFFSLPRTYHRYTCDNKAEQAICTVYVVRLSQYHTSPMIYHTKNNVYSNSTVSNNHCM